MLEPPLATSSPLLSTKQWGRKKSKNNRRSISLLDVSVIQSPDVTSQKSESYETLTSVCKDSGYVRSEGSWLEEDESKESKDLVEELKFKDVLISELQESNRGLRLRCADAENKIWRLRIKCEEHCGCCQMVKGDAQDGELSSDSNEQFAFPTIDLPTYKRHSLDMNNINAGDNGYSVCRGVLPSNKISTHPGGTTHNKHLVRSLSSGMIPVNKSRVKTHRARVNDHQPTPESLSLSKVQWWQRDLFPQAIECSKDLLQSDPSAPCKKISDESYNSNQISGFSAEVANDARLISRLVCQNNDELSEIVGGHERSEKFNKSDNRSVTRKGTVPRSLKFPGRQQIVDSSSESDSSFSALSSMLLTEKPTQLRDGDHISLGVVNRGLQSDSFDGPQYYQPPTLNNLGVSRNSVDAMTRIPSFETGSCHVSSQPCFSSSPNGSNTGFLSQPHCGCAHPPSQIFIVPAGCCCRLVDNSACRQSCCLSNGNTKCDQQCHPSSNHVPGNSESPENLPLSVPKSKSTSVQRKDSSSNSNCDSQVIPKHIPDQCTDKCCCATPCSGFLTVPLCERLDSKSKMIGDIKERMNKLASNGRAETDSLTFKPWPPPHFAEMSPLMRCLAETSDYARQMAMVFEKVNGRVRRISEMNQLNPLVSAD